MCEIGVFVFASVTLFPFLFKIFFYGGYGISFNFFFSFGSFLLVHLLKAHMKLNGQK